MIIDLIYRSHKSHMQRNEKQNIHKIPIQWFSCIELILNFIDNPSLWFLFVCEVFSEHSKHLNMRYATTSAQVWNRIRLAWQLESKDEQTLALIVQNLANKGDQMPWEFLVRFFGNSYSSEFSCYSAAWLDWRLGGRFTFVHMYLYIIELENNKYGAINSKNTISAGSWRMRPNTSTDKNYIWL